MAKQIKFHSWNCEVRFSRYADGASLAICLVAPKTYEPIARATVNLAFTPPPEGHVWIKDWSENEGMLAALVSQGIVQDTGVREPTGHVTAALCKLCYEPEDDDWLGGLKQ